ncbi:CdaR family protein [Oceanithermus sp.]
MRPFELVRRLLHNWPIKLAAVLTALVLWYQLRETEPVVERSLERPLQIVGLGEDRAAVGLPKTVLVRFSGTARVVEGLNPSAVVAFVDLSGVDEGPFTAPVQVRTPSGVRLVQVIPAKIEARVERLGAGVLPVEVFAPGSVVTFEPANVEMRGPAGQVEQARAAVGVDLNAEGTVHLVAVDAQGRPLGDLELTPNQARVTARAPALTRKTVDLVLLPAPKDVHPAGVEAPEKVTIVGPPAVLAEITAVQAEAEWHVGEYTAPLKLLLPPEVDAVGEVLAHLKVEPAKPLE